MEELEPVLRDRVLPEVFAHVVEVDVLEDNVFQVETNGSHLRSGLKILDDGLGDTALNSYMFHLQFEVENTKFQFFLHKSNTFLSYFNKGRIKVPLCQVLIC